MHSEDHKDIYDHMFFTDPIKLLNIENSVLILISCITLRGHVIFGLIQDLFDCIVLNIYAFTEALSHKEILQRKSKSSKLSDTCTHNKINSKF